MLVYAGRVELGPYHTADMIVDARTGEMLDFDVFDLMAPGGRISGGLVVPPLKPLPLPTDIRSWRVAVDEAGWKAWSAPAKAALVPVLSATPILGKSVVLSDGLVALAATYDVKRNLLVLTGKSKDVQAFRPSPALADLLRRKTKG